MYTCILQYRSFQIPILLLKIVYERGIRSLRCDWNWNARYVSKSVLRHLCIHDFIAIRLISSTDDINYLKTLPTNGIFSTRKRLRLLILSGVEYPPRKPAPSAKANSSSIVAPPVTHKRINLNADALKYVVDIKESKMPRATAIPAAKGNVWMKHTKIAHSSCWYLLKH